MDIEIFNAVKKLESLNTIKSGLTQTLSGLIEEQEWRAVQHVSVRLIEIDTQIKIYERLSNIASIKA